MMTYFNIKKMSNSTIAPSTDAPTSTNAPTIENISTDAPTIGIVSTNAPTTSPSASSTDPTSTNAPTSTPTARVEIIDLPNYKSSSSVDKIFIVIPVILILVFIFVCFHTLKRNTQKYKRSKVTLDRDMEEEFAVREYDSDRENTSAGDTI